MLGLIVVAPENGPGLRPDALLEPLLGVPLLSRAIGGALPSNEAVTAVVVVPADLVERVRDEAVGRFALDEVERVIAGGPDFASAVRAGLEALPGDVDRVLVQHASQVLAPTGLADRVVAALSKEGAAAPAGGVRGHVVAEEDGGLLLLEIRPRLRALQGPQAFEVGRLAEALRGEAAERSTDAAELLASNGASVALVDGDADNLLLEDEADVSRAVEVFARRAVDYAFLYPKDLLPEDPLRNALAAGEPLEAPAADDAMASESTGEYDMSGGDYRADDTSSMSPAPGSEDSP